MKVQDAMEILGLLASDQRGLVTTKQAEENGVSRLYLQRLEADETLIRKRTGVYALPSSVPGALLDTYATWLFLTETRNNSSEKHPVVVSGQTSARLHEIGQFAPDHYEFTVAKQRRTRQPDIKFQVRTLDSADVTDIDSMPILTVEATLEQLERDGVDADHLQRASTDAVASKLSFADTMELYSKQIRSASAGTASLAEAMERALAPHSEQFKRLERFFADFDKLQAAIAQMSPTFNGFTLPESPAMKAQLAQMQHQLQNLSESPAMKAHIAQRQRQLDTMVQAAEPHLQVRSIESAQTLDETARQAGDHGETREGLSAGNGTP